MKKNVLHGKMKRLYNRCKYYFWPKVVINYIEDQILQSFEKSLKDSSEDSLYYDTWFRVYLEEKDYRCLHQDFREIVRRTTKEMVRIIKQDGRYFDKYEAHTSAWQISFIKFVDGTCDKVTGEKIDLSKKHPIWIVTSRFPEEEKINPNTNTFTAVINGQVQSIPLNKNVFKNIEKVGEGDFIAPIYALLSEESSSKRIATITLTIQVGDLFLVNNNKTDKYVMKEHRLYIGGRNSPAQYNNIPVLKIDNERIPTAHAIIINDNGKLRIDEIKEKVFYGRKEIKSYTEWQKGVSLNFANITQIKNE